MDEDQASAGAQFGPTALLHPWKAAVARRLSRSISARVPECPGIQPQLRCQHQPARCLRAGNSCSALFDDRLETDKAITPTTKSLQIRYFACAVPAHRTAGPESQVNDKSPADRANHGARGTRTPDLLGAIHQLRAWNPRGKWPISRDFPRMPGERFQRGLPRIVDDTRGARHSWR
jgi:hypothetical protein